MYVCITIDCNWCVSYKPTFIFKCFKTLTGFAYQKLVPKLFDLGWFLFPLILASLFHEFSPLITTLKRRTQEKCIIKTLPCWPGETSVLVLYEKNTLLLLKIRKQKLMWCVSPHHPILLNKNYVFCSLYHPRLSLLTN